MRSSCVLLQKTYVKVKPCQPGNLQHNNQKLKCSLSETISAKPRPGMSVKVEPAQVLTTNDFEEVSIDGTESNIKSTNNTRDEILVYMCNACKIYFSVKSMLEKHHETVHSLRVKELRTKNKQTMSTGKAKDKIGLRDFHNHKRDRYVCNYCPFESSVPSIVSSHITHKHVLISDYSDKIVQKKNIEIKFVNSYNDKNSHITSTTEPKVKESEDDNPDRWPIYVIEDINEADEESSKPEEIFYESDDALTERARMCPYCSFETSKRSTFHSHIKRKHRERWLESISLKAAPLHVTKNDYANKIMCEYCGFISNNRSTMDLHNLRKHPTKLQTNDDVKEECESNVEYMDDSSHDHANVNSIVEEEDIKKAKLQNKPHKCPYCLFESWITSDLYLHASRHHPDKDIHIPTEPAAETSDKFPSAQLYTGYACHFCTFVAATVASFHAHTAREHSDQRQAINEVPVTEYDCDQCDFKSRNRRDMQLHVKKFHKTEANAEGMYSCPACSYETSSRMGLQRHVSIKHNKPRRETLASIRSGTYFDCDRCDFKCLNRKTMDWHRRQHSAPSSAESEGKTYSCNDCDFSTWTKGQLYLHITRRHKNDDREETTPRPEASGRLFVCEQCDYTSKNKHVMKVHVIRKHTDEFNHACEICGKKYKVKADLTNHVRFQHREQPIICDVCGKTCRNSNLLYLHQKFAHYKPEFECPICHRRMVSQANLDDHIVKQHEQREDAVCEECGKIFSKQTRLKIHMRIHTGLKPYTCKVCAKTFARRNGLRQHLLIHSGQRPYLCDICGKSFTQKTGLISHRKGHPGSHPPLPRVTIDHVLSELLNDEG